ncbi:DNA-directed RNA polymerase subunit delta [Lapidilactobacillus wuchangensis]|uniref:DNA-directed RNA polymerase subunit delta n=1 Tax=Lapidilactobacillus wuchangensis TaxID=2486001 RepID=UPI000F7AD471|nr:DNA-directed RNA polymerase subunit delta [Lapidilactobacillus wuchangensis]
MELDVFAGQKKSELSMIEVAHAILEVRGEAMPFADLVNELQSYLGASDTEIRSRLGQFYTDLNMDGSFISLGENVWGLREWYSYESIDEEVNHPEDDEERPRKKRRRKVNAFLADVSDDDDVIDYNDDDPEDDDDNDDDEDDAESNDDDEDDETTTKSNDFKNNLNQLDEPSDDDDDDNELDDGIEGQLSEFNDDELVDNTDADFSSDDDDEDQDDDEDDDDDSDDKDKDSQD